MERKYILWVETQEKCWRDLFRRLEEGLKERYVSGVLSSNAYEDEICRLQEEENVEIEALYLRALARGANKKLLAEAIKRNNPACKDALVWLEDLLEREW